MKKFILICTTFAIIGSMSSCVKEFNCTCTYDDGTGEKSVVAELKTKKGLAEDACSDTEDTWKLVDPDAKCVLD